MYQYRPIEEAKPGDVVECMRSDASIGVTKGKLYLVGSSETSGNGLNYTDDRERVSKGLALHEKFWKLLKTKPGIDAEVGDTVIRLDKCIHQYKLGTVRKPIEDAYLRYYLVENKKIPGDGYLDDFLVLCKEPTHKFNVGKKLRVSFTHGFVEDNIVTIDAIKDGNYYFSNKSGEKGHDSIPSLEKMDYYHDDVIQVGDTVRYIGPRDDYRERSRPSTCTVLEIDGTQLYYTNGYACDIKYWERVDYAWSEREAILPLSKEHSVELHRDSNKFKIGDIIKVPFVYYGESGYVKIYNVDSASYYYEGVENGHKGHNSISRTEETASLVVTSGLPPKNLCEEIPMPYLDDEWQGFGAFDGIEYTNAPIKMHYAFQQITKQKGNKVKDTIKIEINGEKIELCKHEAAACLKPKTDFERKLKYCMVVYRKDGSHEKNMYRKSEKAIIKLKDDYLQNPDNLGKKVTLHARIGGVYTTAIPVVEMGA